MQSYSKDHVLSHSIDDCTADLVHPLPRDEALLGDLVIVHHGPYVGWRGSIEWINPDGFWVHFNNSAGNDLANEDSMILVEPCNVHVEPTPHTLTLTEYKGYNITVGDTMEVARGNYYCFQGVVKAVDLTNALLDIVRPVEGNQVSFLFLLCSRLYWSFHLVKYFYHILLQDQGTFWKRIIQLCWSWHMDYKWREEGLSGHTSYSWENL